MLPSDIAELEPDEVVEPVDDGMPLEGCERSPCDRLPVGGVLDDGIVDGLVDMPELPEVVAGPTSLARSVAAVGAGPGIVVPVVLDGVPADVAGPTFSVRSVAVADGVGVGVCAEAMPIETNSAAAAAAVLRRLNVFMCTPDK